MKSNRADTVRHSITQGFYSILNKFWDTQKRELGICVLIIVMGFTVSLFSPHFFTIENIMSIFGENAIVGIAALGQCIALISGGFDLSIGSIAGLSGMVAAHYMVAYDSIALGVLLGLLTGILCGLFNGFLIGKVGINPFVTTLGTMNLYLGIIYFWTQGQPIIGIPQSFYPLGQGKILGLPSQFFIFILAIIALHIVLTYTSLGRKIYSIGFNEVATKYSGLNTSNTKVILYSIGGFLAAVAGIIMVAKLSTAHPTSGQAWMLPTFAASVIGGTSLQGGEGKAIAPFLGILFIGIVANALVLLGISLYFQQVIQGSFVLLALLFDKFYSALIKKVSI